MRRLEFLCTIIRLRYFSVKCKETVTESCVKAYNEIPGPKGPLNCGNIFNYLPFIGKYNWLELHKAGQDMYDKYGTIVKERMLPGMDILWLYDPHDIASLLNNKEQPWRQSHLALEKYRKDRPHYYKSGGLLPTNGPEWWRLRSELQKSISTPKAVRGFLTDIDQVIMEFLDVLPKDTIVDVLPKLLRLNLELICLITFGIRMNAFSEEEQHMESLTSKMIRSAEITNSLIQPTDQGFRLWRYFNTMNYKKLCKAQGFIESIAIKLIEQSLATNKMRPCLVQKYYANAKLDYKDILGVACDFLLAGTDTTSYTAAFSIYYLAKYPEVQQELYDECAKVASQWGHDTMTLNNDILNNEIPFARAVLKEVLRLNPISVGVGRLLQNDMVLSNYHVPKGTIVVTQNMVACRLERNFLNPLEFNPARWLNQSKNSINPYLVMPFGHGIRACIARRLAEQNILVLLLRLVQQYQLIWRDDNGTEIGVKTALINKPSQPIKIEFSQRKYS